MADRRSLTPSTVGLIVMFLVVALIAAGNPPIQVALDPEGTVSGYRRLYWG